MSESLSNVSDCSAGGAIASVRPHMEDILNGLAKSV